MVRIIVFISLIFCFTACADQQKKLKVDLKITNPTEGGWIKLEKIVNDQKLETADSIQYSSNAKTSFEVAVSTPTLYRINFFGRQMVNVILNNSDVLIEAAGNAANASSKVTGSPDTDLLNEAIGLEQEFQQQVQALNSVFMEARSAGDTEQAMQLQQQYLVMENKHKSNLKAKIWSMENSIAALFAATLIKDFDQSFTFLDSLATRFKTALPDSEYTKDLVSKVEGVRNTAVGSFAPDINLPTPTGEAMALSSLRGKYILVDFWAAWCRPCRMENPNIVRAYQQYASKGFDVFGVSLDRTKEDWVKAIEADGLTWSHVSDLKYFQSEAANTYNITFIPQSFLLDPEGKIIAKNLRGEDLINKLSELLD